MRRITQRGVAVGMQAEIASDIAGELRVGQIDGVEIDFRHSQLPPGDWEAAPWWNVWHRPPSSAGIIFPTEARCGIEELRQLKHLPDLEAVYAYRGDRISIETVVERTVDRRFDHEHDRTLRFATLRIDRPSGEIGFPPGPLAFEGTTRVRETGIRNTFDRVLARILRHAQIRDFPADGLAEFGLRPFWDGDLKTVAVQAGHQAHEAFFQLRDGLHDEVEDLNGSRLTAVANFAALAGYLLGKVEAQKPERIADGTMRNRELATARVRRSDWREKAKQIWCEHPDYYRTRVAKMIADGTDDDVSSVMRGIKELDPHPPPAQRKRLAGH